MRGDVLTLNSVTQLTARADHAVAYCASHAGQFAAAVALQARLRAVILNDAGVGLRQAGIASLAILARYGIPAATISHRSARIGDGRDGYERGKISYVNSAASALGVRVGHSCQAALHLLAERAAAPSEPQSDAPHVVQRRRHIYLGGVGLVVLVDSNSLLTQSDAGHFVVCGSHGAVLGNDPRSAVPAEVRAIVFNDADRGVDDAGISRLPALDQRGIPAACVSAWTACIGDARSSLETGIISALNRVARDHGAEPGMTTQEFLQRLAARLSAG